MSADTTTAIAVGTERQYFDQLAAGQFMIQRCGSCSQHVFPPREFCNHCGTDALFWVEPTGLGTVYSHTTVARKAEAGGNYNIVLVDLDEGVRLMSTVVDLAPEHLRIGLKVRAHVEKKDEAARVVFTEVKG